MGLGFRPLGLGMLPRNNGEFNGQESQNKLENGVYAGETLNPKPGYIPVFLPTRTGDDELYVNRRMVIVLNYCQYGVLYLGSYYNTGPYINFPFLGTVI